MSGRHAMVLGAGLVLAACAWPIRASHAGPPVYDIRDYGAAADDGVNDQAAIQTAILQAGAAGGGVVLVPAGEFEVHSTVGLVSHVYLHGVDRDLSTIRTMGDFHTLQFQGTPGEYLVDTEVRHLTLIGNGNPLVNFATLAAFTEFVDGCVVDDNRLLNANYDGVFLLSDCRNVEITNNIVEGFGDDGINPGGNDSPVVEGTNNVLVANNVIRNGAHDGIHISSNTFAITVRDNLVENCDHGIGLFGADYSEIRDNTLVGNYRGIGTVSGSHDGMRIHGNTITGSGHTAIWFKGRCSTIANNTGDTWFFDLWGRSRQYDNDMANGIVGNVPGDANCDQAIDFADILAIIAAWGPCGGATIDCYEDLDGSGDVGFADLLLVISGWWFG
jgi:parallel beta-helix repeat protein